MLFVSFQNLIITVVYLVFAALKLWALIDCARQKQQYFPAVQRQSKTLWLVLTGLSALTGLVFAPLGIVGIAGVVVALIYLFEVKPRIQELTGPRRY